jgi:hypothetical protein
MRVGEVRSISKAKSGGGSMVIPNQLGNATDDNLYRLCNRDFTYLYVAFLILGHLD